MNIKGFLDVVKNDWAVLSRLMKFSFAYALLCLAVAWLFRPEPLVLVVAHRRLFVSSILKLDYLLLLFFSLVLPSLIVFYDLNRIRTYRMRYPMKNHGREFYFAMIPYDPTDLSKGGPVFLIDRIRKSIRWIENPPTAFDLGYYPTCITESIVINSLRDVIPKKSERPAIHLDEYQIDRGIRTHGKPGEVQAAPSPTPS